MDLEGFLNCLDYLWEVIKSEKNGDEVTTYYRSVKRPEYMFKQTIDLDRSVGEPPPVGTKGYMGFIWRPRNKG